MGGPDQQLDALRTPRERFENVALAVGDHRHAGSAGTHRGGLIGPLQPAEALLLLDRNRPPGRAPAPLPLQKRAVDQPQDRPVLRIHRQHRVQIIAAAAVRAQHRRVLDREDMPSGTAGRRPLGGFRQHLGAAHRLVAQKPGQPDLSRTAAAQPPHPQLAATRRHQAAQKKGPPFSRRRSPNRPSRSSMPSSRRTQRQRIRHIQPLQCQCVNAVARAGPARGEGSGSPEHPWECRRCRAIARRRRGPAGRRRLP